MPISQEDLDFLRERAASLAATLADAQAKIDALIASLGAARAEAADPRDFTKKP